MIGSFMIAPFEPDSFSNFQLFEEPDRWRRNSLVKRVHTGPF
jgi:hypothetical protein